MQISRNIYIIGGEGRFGKLLGNFLRENFSKNVIRIQSIEQWQEDLIEYPFAIIFAVPMQELGNAISRVKPYVLPYTIIFDVCSLKVFSTKLLAEHFPNNPVIGTHPLFGPQSFDKTNLSKYKIVLCNVSASDELFADVQNHINDAGFSTVVCSAEYHDKEMAKTQALTHFIGRIAEKMNMKRSPLSTKSYDDLMDIIMLVRGGSKELFMDMQTLNPFAKEQREQFICAATDLGDSINSYGKD